MFDFIVVGSGVSGGRIAHDLAGAGANCALLEAGREFNHKTFPETELDSAAQTFWGGGAELTTDGRLGLLRAKCLGGSSVVNQALLDRFDDDAFTDWNARTGVSFFSLEKMNPVYEQIEESLSIQSIPERFYNRNAKIFEKALRSNSVAVAPLRRGQSDCRFDLGADCIVCLKGCPRNSKQSTLVTSIPKAREHGLQVFTECEAQSVKDLGDHVRVVASQNGKAVNYEAKKVVLACGSVGNSKILLQSKQFKEHPKLGKDFTCHPQYMTYGVFDEEVNAHKGPLQSLKSYDPNLRKRGFKLENVFAPPIGTAMLIPGIGREHMAQMKKYRYMASIEVCIRDEAVGTISVDRSGRLRFKKKLTAIDRRIVKDGLNLVTHLFESAGAKEVIRGQQGFGLHLMGGCKIGENASTSVVAPDFTLHDSKNIYAADSSVFPSAPGINPSLTIMALSHLAAKEMLKRAG